MRDEHQSNFDISFADSKGVDAHGLPLVVFHHSPCSHRASIQAHGLVASDDTSPGGERVLFFSDTCNLAAGMDVYAVKASSLRLRPDDTTDAPAGERWFAAYHDVPAGHVMAVAHDGLALHAEGPRKDDLAGFNGWFAHSKVVDAEGAPLTLFHGSNHRFDTFDPSKAGMGNDRGMRGRGLYFTPNPNTAASYGVNVMQVHVCLRNPFNPDDFPSKAAIATRLGIDEGVFEFSPDEDFRVYQPFSGLFTGALKDAGYDGVMYLRKQEVIAFEASQIRFAAEPGANQRAVAAQAARDYLDCLPNAKATPHA